MQTEIGCRTRAKSKPCRSSYGESAANLARPVHRGRPGWTARMAPQGLDGRDGRDGLNGLQGARGNDGIDGKDGLGVDDFELVSMTAI